MRKSNFLIFLIALILLSLFFLRFVSFPDFSSFCGGVFVDKNFQVGDFFSYNGKFGLTVSHLFENEFGEKKLKKNFVISNFGEFDIKKIFFDSGFSWIFFDGKTTGYLDFEEKNIDFLKLKINSWLGKKILFLGKKEVNFCSFLQGKNYIFSSKIIGFSGNKLFVNKKFDYGQSGSPVFVEFFGRYFFVGLVEGNLDGKGLVILLDNFL